MEKYISFLTKTKLFNGITETELSAMLQCLSAVKKEYKKGEYIFRCGEQIQSVALLLHGSVHIRKEDYWGNLSILSEVLEGEVFGEVYASLGAIQADHHAVAMKDTDVLFLDLNHVLTTCSSACQFHRRLIQNLLFVLATKNNLLTQKIEHMSQRTTREKLLSYLSEQSIKAGSSSFDLTFNRQQLADFLSVDRSAMSNELCKMRDEGLLVFDRNHIELK